MNPAELLEKGLTAHRAGDMANAAAVYRQMLELWPGQPDASYLLGLIVQKNGDHLEAIRLFEQATEANPNLARAHLQRGFSLNALDQAMDAVAAFQSAVARETNLPEAHHQLGNTLRKLKRLPEALPSLREATRLKPAEAIYWLSRGLACMEGELWDEAVKSFQQAVRFNSTLPEAREILAQALMAQHRGDEARDQLNEALRLRPNYAEACHDLGRLCTEEGLIKEAVEHYRAALIMKPEPETQTNLVFLFNYLPETKPEEHFAEHRRWSEWFEQPLRSDWCPHPNDRNPERQLRIGYVSPDFRDHPVSCFIEPVLKHHRWENVEVYGYANVKTPDAVSVRLSGFASQWRNIYGLKPSEVAELVRQDEIDILIDLAGHTTGNSLLAFAHKPAPVQVTWIGYPNTTGLDAMDYRITDFISDPPGQTEQWHSEYLVRMPKTFSCYCAPAESPAVGTLPALENGFVTFGSFNNFRKLSEPAIALWGRILRAIPSSRLLIKSQGLGNPKVVGRLCDQFIRAGVNADRIEFLGAGLSKEMHMGLYNRVDICLDPFPYNGTTTTCDALWMGLPVITLAGKTHVSRVGMSLVTHLGHSEWAVESEDAYVAKCRELADDLPALARMRVGLREKMRQSPLCDAPQFVKDLEIAYRAMWMKWCAQ